MSTIEKTSWPLGWTPNANDFNGDPRGLLKMNNCVLDDEGILSLIPGNANINSSDFGSAIHTIYSKAFATTKHRFVACADGTVRHSTGASFSNLITGGSAQRTGFTHAYDNVFIFSESQRKRFNGTTTTNITPGESTDAPAVQEAAKNDFVFFSSVFTSFSLIEGANFDDTSNFVQWDTTESIGIVQSDPASPWNTMVFPSTGNQGTLDDLFMLWVTFSDPTLVKKVKVIFNLRTNYDPPADYYWIEWDKAKDAETGFFGTSTFTATRGQFNREGNSIDESWSNVEMFRVEVETTGVVTCRIPEGCVLFTSYNESPITGYYEYMQVNVVDTGSYLGRSKPSPVSLPVTPLGGRVQITAASVPDAQVTHVWIYRRDAQYRTGDVLLLGVKPRLDRWYRVAEIAIADIATPIEDGISDETLLRNINVLTTYPLYSVEGVSIYTDNHIWDVSELFNDRFILMGDKDIYFTLERDLGLYNPLWAVRVSGSTVERNLWIKKISYNQCLLGTTEDVYEISGTLSELPDGTLDVFIRPLGLSYPPISRVATKDTFGVFYIAKDGVRYVQGTTTQKITTALDTLWQGSTRYDTPAIVSKMYDQGKYAIALSKARLYFAAELATGGTRVFVYDLVRQYWREWLTAPTHLFTEEDDTLIGGYNSTDYFLKTLVTGTSIDGVAGQSVEIRTIFDANGQPRNRKDTFTLKIRADSGNVNLTIALSKDGGAWQTIATQAFNGRQEFLYDVSTHGLGFHYGIKITGSSLTVFKLYLVALEYQERPEQQKFLRIQYTNFDYAGKKRVRTLPFEIDTLGNNITVTPYLDGSTLSTSSTNTSTRRTAFHYFTTDINGIDYELTFSGGTFEFYRLLKPEIVEVGPVGKKFDQVGPIDIRRWARIHKMRVYVETTGTELDYTLYLDGAAIAGGTGTITTEANVPKIYEVSKLPKGIQGATLKVELGPQAEIFYRYWVDFLVGITGAETDGQWIRLGGATE